MLSGFSRKLKAPRKGRFSLEQVLAGLGASLLILSWLTTEHFLPWVSWHAETLTVVTVFFLTWIAIAVQFRSEPSHRIRVPLIAAPFTLFAMVALAQGLTGIMSFWGDVFVVWFYTALCITCVILGFNAGAAPEPEPRGAVPKRWTSTTWLALAFVIGSIASVVVAFAQVFDLWEYSPWIARMPDLRRPGGNLGQPNQLATLLVMGVASAAFLHVSGKLSASATGLVLFVLCAGLAVTESRTGVLGLAILLLWWQFKRRAIAGRISPWAAPAVGVGFAAMFMVWPHLLNSLHLLSTQAESRLGQGDLRLAMWAQLLEAVAQRPWFGWGIAQVAEAHNSVADAHAINNAFSYSHNLLIDWAVWMGLPIAVVLTSITAFWLWRRLRETRQLTPWYCLAVAVPLATHSMLEFPFAYAYFLAPVLFLLGVLETSLGVKPLLRVGLKPVLGILLVVSGALIWSVAEYLAIEEDFRVVRFEQLRIGHTPSDHYRPNVAMLTQLGTLLSGSRIALQPGMSRENLEQLKKLALRYPWVATQYRYALALALNGNQTEAIRQFQVIRWQRDEKLYGKIKNEVAELAKSRYPELRTLTLP
jgi:O-antigen ligase